MLIANDIVYLPYWYSHWKNRWDKCAQKIATEAELEWLYEKEFSLPFSNKLFSLWAAKEAAYKIAQQLGAPRLFQPKKYEYSRRHFSAGTIKSDYGQFSINIETAVKFIHVIAAYRENPDDFSLYHRWIYFYNGQEEGVNSISQFVQEQGLISLTKKSNLKIEELSIRKINEIPYLYRFDKPVNMSINWSHDGPFAAFVWTDMRVE